MLSETTEGKIIWLNRPF